MHTDKTEDTAGKKVFEKETTEIIRESVEESIEKEKAPLGPFEHSGEAAGWTKAEEKAEENESK